MRYHVHGLRLADARHRGERRHSAETEDLTEALALAKQLAGEGFRCWVYGHEHVVTEREGMLTRTRYRAALDVGPGEWEQVGEFNPGGRRVR